MSSRPVRRNRRRRKIERKRYAFHVIGAFYKNSAVVVFTVRYAFITEFDRRAGVEYFKKFIYI